MRKDLAHLQWSAYTELVFARVWTKGIERLRRTRKTLAHLHRLDTRPLRVSFKMTLLLPDCLAAKAAAASATNAKPSRRSSTLDDRSLPADLFFHLTLLLFYDLLDPPTSAKLINDAIARHRNPTTPPSPRPPKPTTLYQPPPQGNSSKPSPRSERPPTTTPSRWITQYFLGEILARTEGQEGRSWVGPR